MKNGRNGNGHERFDELCALAMSGSLTPEEQRDLQAHLRACSACCEEYERYLLLTREGMPLLARRYAGVNQTDSQLDGESKSLGFGPCDAGERVLARIPASEQIGATGLSTRFQNPSRFAAAWHAVTSQVAGAVAACLVIVASYGVYQFVERSDAAEQAESRAERRAESLAGEKRKLAEQLTAQQARVTQLEAQSAQKRGEIEALKAQVQAEFEHESQRVAELTASSNTAANAARAKFEEQLRTSAHDGEVLSAKLRDMEAAYQNAQIELVNLRAERDRATLRMASLETENNALVADGRDQERRLRNQEQFLDRDRDIRDLMGSRQLYMADVIDVSSDSRTRKPYGRIFYTKNKRLLFYAFDLDRQPGVKNVTFQAWGRNESSQGTPVSLGILYQDDEQNRRWVLRTDDPGQLAEIDAVFVTIEPHGGSQKPTGKPFLTASLRREPNHP